MKTARNGLRIVQAQLGNHAGTIGAALWALDREKQ